MTTAACVHLCNCCSKHSEVCDPTSAILHATYCRGGHTEIVRLPSILRAKYLFKIHAYIPDCTSKSGLFSYNDNNNIQNCIKM